MRSTDAGYINKNNQKNLGLVGMSQTHYNQRFFQMECLECGHRYEANGCDVWLRKCPLCQGKKATPNMNSRAVSDKLRYQVLKRDNFKCCACA